MCTVGRMNGGRDAGWVKKTMKDDIVFYVLIVIASRACCALAQSTKRRNYSSGKKKCPSLFRRIFFGELEFIIGWMTTGRDWTL